MFITYLKETGEIVAPIVTSDTPLTLQDIMGEEKGNIYSQIYDYINIIDNKNIFDNLRKYYVDIETKELREKAEKEKEIQYL